jgi:preprotein translocase subunit Sec61beta
MKMLEQAKKALGSPDKIHLIVGVCSGIAVLVLIINTFHEVN